MILARNLHDQVTALAVELRGVQRIIEALAADTGRRADEDLRRSLNEPPARTYTPRCDEADALEGALNDLAHQIDEAAGNVFAALRTFDRGPPAADVARTAPQAPAAPPRRRSRPATGARKLFPALVTRVPPR